MNAWNNVIMTKLKEKRTALGLSQADLAALCGTSPPQIHRLEHGQRELTLEWAKKLAPCLDCDPLDLIENSEQFTDIIKGSTPHKKLVMVVGYLQAGEWREAIRWHNDDYYEVPVFDNRYESSDLEGYEVRGDSMNLIYPEGTVVLCRQFDPVHEVAPVGRNVLVQRTDKHGLIEATVKRFITDEYGKGWLEPVSTNPAHQKIAYSPNGSGDDNLGITGIVVGSYRKE